ncbi:MAG: beta-ketoacyl-ACP synthase II [Armatimonadetes bacterium]|nr:beta-ketoacyl-ACP synthase II [Armatimonadota bacterium]
MQDRRVVITGLGALTPLGNTVDEYWEAIKACKNAIGPITHFDASEHPTRIAAEIKDFDATKYVDAKLARRMDTFVQYAVAAAKMAHEDSVLEIDGETATRVGVLVGSGIGGVETWETQDFNIINNGPRRVSPFFVPMLIANMASGLIAILTGAKGPNMAIVTACATACHSIGEAWHMIKRDDADVMFAGGAEAAIRPLSCAGFCTMKAMSTNNDDPEHASRPFDKDRDGFVMGEGSGVLMLEELEHARARGAKIYAELVGYGCSADAYDMVVNSPEGADRSMRNALRRAGIEPEKIDYINAHATSTPVGDPGEVAAIKMAFGDHAQQLMISSTKSMIGHLLGAAGAVESIACIKAITDGVIPPTRNLVNPDPACDLDFVPNEAREAKVEYAMNNSFGFGGQNATLIFKRFAG